MYCCGNRFERARKLSNALPRRSVQSVLVMDWYAHKAPSTKDCDEACTRTTANTTQSDVAETDSPLVLTTVRQLLATRDYNPNVPARWSLQPFDNYWRLVIKIPMSQHVARRWSLQPFDDYWRLVITIPMSQHDGVANASWTLMWPDTGLAMRTIVSRRGPVQPSDHT